MELALSIFWLAAVAGLIFRALRQRNALCGVEPAEPPPAATAPVIAAIVPARNEATNIGACLDGLLAQHYPPDRLAVVVVDDQSTDGTGTVIARRAERDPRLTLRPSPPLPPGWVGKPHACWVGAEDTGAAAAEWLCFVDADVRLDPRALASALSAAVARGVDLLSLVPSQDMLSFAERLVMPCGLYLLAFTHELERVDAPDASDATASGQFILVRRDAYDAIGGHAAVRSAITEDVALARLMKRTGHSIALLGGDGLLRTRMYDGWQTMWPGLSKNLVDMMGGPASTIALAVAGVVLAWLAVLVPILALLACLDAATVPHLLALALALSASAAAFSLHLAGAVYFRIPLWYGLLFPLGYTVGAAMALDSVRQRMVGRVGWKGRTYP
ncbi:MAG TPA: glycosyltransferase family A protein [Hyphomicrobiales bacterium]|nr:glycosyltransferase family A protein [Hyphomicrobiales bacterium]